MTRLQVPRQYQQTALLVGIVIALVMRGIFIAVGAAAINEFSWVFYLFGLFLVWTAYKLAKDDDLDDEPVRRAADRQVRPRPPPGDRRSGTASSCSPTRTARG